MIPAPVKAIRPYRTGDEHAILRSFNLVFRETNGPGYIDRELPLWQWQYLGNPEGHRICLAEAEDGTVAAHYAGVPYRVSTPAGELTFVHIVDSFVHPDYRAGLKAPGLFVCTALPWFKDCYARGDAVPYGFPVPRAERIGQRYLHYHRLRTIDYLCRDASAPLAWPQGIEVHRLGVLDRQVDTLFAEFRRQRACLTVRSASYLSWRYLAHPGQFYEAYGAYRHGELLGLSVLSPGNGLVPGACAIIDWLVPDLDNGAAQALLCAAAERARYFDRNRLMAMFTPHSPESAYLQARAFSLAPSADYFERRLTYQVYEHALSEAFLHRHWWYTLGDSDLA